MHGFANPKRFLSLANWLTPLLLGSGLLVSAGALLWGLLCVAPDRLMGETVRILFLHVPTAWLGMGGWSAIAISSLVFLVWRHPLAALAARAAAVPGFVFTVICLATGSIWGRPTWGTWWVWDGRLTSMLVLAFLYLATALPLASPGPIIEPNAVYIREATPALAVRDVSDGDELARRDPVLSWTWFNNGKKVKRDPVLSWTWFNGGKKTKRDPVLSWTWFNGGKKE